MTDLSLFAVISLYNVNQAPTPEIVKYLVANNGNLSNLDIKYLLGNRQVMVQEQVSVFVNMEMDFSVVRTFDTIAIFRLMDHDGNNDSARYNVLIYQALGQAIPFE